MSKKPKLTIITTTYNQEKYIKQCLDGIVMQKTSFPFQAIISDDYSTDGTRKILKEYQKKYPEIIVPIFREKNLGAMDNFIETVNEADTEYVAFCDGDDFWTDPNKIQKQLEFLENNKDYSICFHQTKIFFEDGSRESDIFPTYIKETTNFEDLIKECFIPANTVMYRWMFTKKNSFKKEFPKNVVPGDYFVHLCHAQNGKIKLIKEVMSNYRRHAEGMWWLTSDNNMQEEFHLKYGVKYLNFFKAVEKRFSLPKKDFIEQKKYLAYQTTKAYLKHKKWDELSSLVDDNEELIDKLFQPVNVDSVYANLSKPKKLLYLLIVDKKQILGRIENKLEKVPFLFKIYKFFKRDKKK
ncbi:MAG: glycosyltransferase [Bacilli bacterium]|nr:glycosyltransferase [Bacilli bacterium]